MSSDELETLSQRLAAVMLHQLEVAGVLVHDATPDDPLRPWPQVLAAARNAVQACCGDLDAMRARAVEEAVGVAPRLLRGAIQ